MIIRNILSSICSALMFLMIGLRWLLFDLAFAKVNYDKWVYYGTSSELDKQLTKLGKYHFIPKIIVIAIGITLIII